MNTEPISIRLRRTARGEAVRRAARYVQKDAPRPGSGVSNALDEAFATLGKGQPASQQGGSSAGNIASQIAIQSQQLDAQGERLANLIADLNEI